MPSNIPLEPPCHECKKCTNLDIGTPGNHPTTFSAVENSPVDGINFKMHKYTANQLAEAFSRMAQDDFDWSIKREAVERWNAILPDLLEGPLFREDVFDLEPIFHILDDLLFRRALRDHCGVAWVNADKSPDGRWDVGWSQKGSNIRGWRHGICVVRPSAAEPRTVQDCLDTLIHEMCHALFSVACQCAVCTCSLNEMNGEGLTGHGPAWQILAPAIEDCVNLWMGGFEDPFRLSYMDYDETKKGKNADASLELERKEKVKFLSGLYCAIEQRQTEAARNKKAERDRRRAERERNTAEGGGREIDDNEALACVRVWFQ
ncbi:hypothetical protein IMSHALPRED_005059 [Imshaugia aleurites]|uniref:SprT-like domain-containing protein n=1 Tax=Imshaugia aleurites TaxID=172621 RepID=A0A8H3F7V0_9LECA|nr:hypothetical protein IMSHALPRED_005059 [Imshaugia aleurites]